MIKKKKRKKKRWKLVEKRREDGRGGRMRGESMIIDAKKRLLAFISGSQT